MPSIPDAEARRFAEEILEWRASRTPRQPFTGLPPGDLDAAYDVQEALHPLLAAAGAGEVVGYKIALTSRTMQQMVGVDTPLGGALFSSLVQASPATVRPREFLRLGLECEVAVRLAADLPTARAPHTRESVAAAVDGCTPAFELVEDGKVDYQRIDAPTLIVDNCWNGGVVLGGWVAGAPERWLDAAFADARTVLEVDGEEIAAGRVRDAMGHPFEAVAWVANLLARRGQALRRGMMVMTGSSVRTVFPEAGQHARFRIEDLGTAELTLAD
jgi:2-keto-4-pentenoate hydratase